MNCIKKYPVIIIDGNLYLYRSYYTFKNYKCIQGKASGVIYGMLRMIYHILTKYKNSKSLIIIFDSSRKTFRTTLFPEYKNNRSPMPNELYIQIEPLCKILNQIGIKTLNIPGIEADDIIGSLANQLEQQGEKILIVSHDKDMLQLVTKNINILHPNKSIITSKKIKEIYGIQPREFIDFLALMGDASDNIPGVPKIGEKTALFLLNNFSNLKNIYYNLEKVQFLSFRNAKNISIQLKNHKKDAFLSYKLAEIKLDFMINVTLQDMKVKSHYVNHLSYFFKIYGFYKS